MQLDCGKEHGAHILFKWHITPTIIGNPCNVGDLSWIDQRDRVWTRQNDKFLNIEEDEEDNMFYYVYW